MRKETLLSPLSGIIYQIYATSGSLVSENELILQIECMKLFYDVTAGLNGRLDLKVQSGEFVQEGQEIGTIIESSS